MTRNIVKYVGIVLVIAGILVVMKNLVTSDTEWKDISKKNTKDKTTEIITYYNAKITLMDQDTKSLLQGADLAIKNDKGEIIEKWTTENGAHIVNRLTNGKYTIYQEKTKEGYHSLEQEVTFTIDSKDSEVSLYNTKMTEAEQQAERIKNTTSEEIGVENTLSEKNIWFILGGIASISIGVGLILFQKGSRNNQV